METREAKESIIYIIMHLLSLWTVHKLPCGHSKVFRSVRSLARYLGRRPRGGSLGEGGDTYHCLMP